MKLSKLLLATSMLTFSSLSNAFIHEPEAQIQSIAVWEGSDQKELYFTINGSGTSGTWCYIKPEDKLLKSLVMTIYASGKTASIHCYDQAEKKRGGLPAAHKVHRVLAR